MVTISHFSERFRGGQYTLVSFLFAPRCSTCPAICKSGARPRALWFRTHCWGTAPRWWCWVRLSERRKSLSLVQGQRKPWYGVWCLPVPSYL